MATKAEQATLAGAIRDRVKEFRRVPASELVDNERNWRVHPYAQKQAIAELLDKVGIAGALTAYESERNGGRLTLIDGHERRSQLEDGSAEWPVLVLDVTDEEADLLLLTMDPIAGLAESDPNAVDELLASTGGVGTPALEDVLAQLQAGAIEAGASGSQIEVGEEGPPEMELQTFEHYDYIVFLFRDVRDWRAAKERLGLGQEAFTLKDGETRKVGFGRVLDGARLIDLLTEEAE